MSVKITHTAINGHPVVDIVRDEVGANADKPFAINYGSSGIGHKSSIEHYGLTQQEFPLHRVIRDYFAYYGPEKATEILVGKGIITSTPRSIIWLP